jgi:phosphate-selective porin OprO/OprP
VKRKFVAAGAALLATALIGQTASAKTLEDVLKEKGVITEADYKEVTKVKPIDYKLGKGFTFTSEDGRFQTTLGGRFQFRYTFTDKDGGQDVSQWDAKRIRFWLKGYAYTKDLTYALEVDPRAYASAANKGLLDAWINYKLIDEVQLKVGQYKVPFSRQQLTSDGAQEFVDRSPVVDSMKADYDIGAMLNGKIAKGLLEYNLGVFGGAGQTTGRSDNNNLFAARVAVNPLGNVGYSEADLDYSQKPQLGIAANYFRNTVVKTGTSLDISVPNYASSKGWLGSGFNKSGYAATNDKLDVDSYGADLVFKWMGLFVQSEYLLGQAESQFTGHLLRSQGFYGEAGYSIIPKTLDLAFRYSYYDPDRDIANNNVTEQIGAISYYFNKHNLKLQADVGNTHTQHAGSASTDDMAYRVQAQIIF